MNSNVSLTDDPGRCTLRLFQEIVLHPQFPRLAFQSAKPFPFAAGQRGFLAGVEEPGGVERPGGMALVLATRILEAFGWRNSTISPRRSRGASNWSGK